MSKDGEHPFGDRGQLICLAALAVVWVLDSFFLRVSTFPTEYVPLYARLVVLGLLFVMAIYLMQAGHVAVIDGQSGKRVVTTGAFRHVRHPLYLGSVLAYLGVAMGTMSLACLALTVGIFAFYNHTASYEERLLQARFGEQYRQYRLATGKWRSRLRAGS